jgi:hypothetical protein
MGDNHLTDTQTTTWDIVLIICSMKNLYFKIVLVFEWTANRCEGCWLRWWPHNLGYPHLIDNWGKSILKYIYIIFTKLINGIENDWMKGVIEMRC